MKQLKKLQVVLVVVLMFTCSIFVIGCGKNNDNKETPVKCDTFLDANSDTKCDTCGKTEKEHTSSNEQETPVKCDTFLDANSDTKCDTCGKTEAEHTSSEPPTENEDPWSPWYKPGNS